MDFLLTIQIKIGIISMIKNIWILILWVKIKIIKVYYLKVKIKEFKILTNNLKFLYMLIKTLGFKKSFMDHLLITLNNFLHYYT